MKLIAQLNEASNVSVEDLKKAMQKDKRVKKIFNAKLQVDEIDDMKEFLETLRYYFFNNQHVLDFVRTRGPGSPRVSKWWFDQKRLIRPDGEITQDTLEDIQRQVKELFRDLTDVTVSALTKTTMEEIEELTGTYRPRQISPGGIKELLSLPGIRPSKPVMLFRGLMYEEKSLREVPMVGGGMQVGDGLKLLRSIRQGTRVADVEFDKQTVWTPHKDVALSMAFRGQEGSYLDKGEMTATKGDAAFVLSAIFQPGQIIADTTMIPKAAKYKYDPVIVAPGKFTVRISHQFNKKGEVDPTKNADEVDDESSKVVNAMEIFAHVFHPPAPDPEFIDMDRGFGTPESMESFREMLDPALGAKIEKSLDVINNFYHKRVAIVSDDDLTTLLASPEHSHTATVARAFVKLMKNSLTHDDFKANDNRSGSAFRHEMTGAQQLESRHYVSIRDMLDVLKAHKRFTDWGTGAKIENVVRAAGLGTYIQDLHRKPGAIQIAEMEKAVQGFFDIAHRQRPENWLAAVTEIAKMTIQAERNARHLKFIWEVRNLFDSLKEDL